MSNYGFCNIGMMPVRSEPAHRSEMVNMLLFGDVFEIIESVEQWHHIKTCHDEYPGWVNIRKVMTADEEFRFREANEQAVFCGSTMICLEKEGQMTQVTFGSRIHYREGGIMLPQNERLPGEVIRINRELGLTEIAEKYMGTPYLWGGRSIYGIDCSGFTQIVYRMKGIALPRDAWQQAEGGVKVESLEETKAGDLAFFAEKDKITHVGILSGDGHIIHASGKVRKEKLDEEGIFSEELQKHTLPVVVIKRY
jgi:hypothetical protein